MCTTTRECIYSNWEHSFLLTRALSQRLHPRSFIDIHYRKSMWLQLISAKHSCQLFNTTYSNLLLACIKIEVIPRLLQVPLFKCYVMELIGYAYYCYITWLVLYQTQYTTYSRENLCCKYYQNQHFLILLSQFPLAHACGISVVRFP